MIKLKKLVLLMVMSVMIFSVFAACGSNSGKGSKENDCSTPQEAMYEYMDAVNSKDAKRLMKLYMPEDLAEELAKKDGVNIESIEDEAKWLIQGVEEKCGKNYKMDIDISEERYLKGEELAEIKDEYKEITGADIQDVCVLTVKMTVKGEKENIEDTDPMTFFKYNGRWYISDL